MQQGDHTSELLLQLPRLVLIKNGHASLLFLSTGFYKKNPGHAVRTMDLAAFNTAQALSQAKYNIVVVHRPHSRDRWMTDVGLGWGGSGCTVPMACIDFKDLSSGAEFKKEGWPPFVELVSHTAWREYNG